METIKVSTPGKLLLMGEHSVVYDGPCLVTAVDQRQFVEISENSENSLELDCPDVGVNNYSKKIEELTVSPVPKGARFVEFAVKKIFQKYNLEKGLKIKTYGDFDSRLGFGSSSAVTVGTIYAISELFNLNLSKREIFDTALETVLAIQGKGSGADLAAAVYGGLLYFKNRGSEIQPLIFKELQLVAGYTGIKYGTVEVLDEVAELEKNFPHEIQDIYQKIGGLVEKAKEIINSKSSNSLKNLGQLMNFNQGYLEALGVNSLELSIIIYACRNAGALGSKLSGAGKGDCAIALVEAENKQKVCESINKAGFKAYDLDVNVEGVRTERL